MFGCLTVVCHVIGSSLFPSTAEEELGQLRKIIRTLLDIILLWKGGKKKAALDSSGLQHCAKVRLHIHFTRRPLHLQDFLLE